MNDKEVALLKYLLRKHIEELEWILGGAQPSAERKHSQSDDPSASLDLTISSEVEDRLIQIAKDELKQLAQNMVWLDSEDAGCCESCGCDIPLDRLVAVPTTRQCIDCAEENDEN